MTGRPENFAYLINSEGILKHDKIFQVNSYSPNHGSNHWVKT